MKRENKCKEPSDCPGLLLEGVSMLLQEKRNQNKVNSLSELRREKQKFPGTKATIIFKIVLETGLCMKQELRGGEGVSANGWL